jgi:hypothetical protein
MQTRDLRERDGRLTGFIVGNMFLDRHDISNVVAKIPGAEIGRKQRRFAFVGPDDFCEFVVDGKTFLVIEPFGDNSEYWIVAQPPEESSELAKVREAFSRHRLLFGLLGG